MKQSSKTALCAMTAALSVVIMLLAAIPSFTLAVPAFAGMLTMFVIIEIDRKWALGVYATVSLIGFFVCPDKEAAVMYIAFFGYYPTVKSLLESKLPRVLEILLKFLIFNLSVVAAYFLMAKFMGIDLTEFTEFGKKTLPLKVALPIILALGNAAFVALDFCLTSFVTVYIKRFQKHFRKLFKL